MKTEVLPYAPAQYGAQEYLFQGLLPELKPIQLPVGITNGYSVFLRKLYQQEDLVLVMGGAPQSATDNAHKTSYTCTKTRDEWLSHINYQQSPDVCSVKCFPYGTSERQPRRYLYGCVNISGPDLCLLWSILKASKLPIQTVVTDKVDTLYTVLRVEAEYEDQFFERIAQIQFYLNLLSGDKVANLKTKDFQTTLLPGHEGFPEAAVLLGTELGLPTFSEWEAFFSDIKDDAILKIAPETYYCPSASKGKDYLAKLNGTYIPVNQASLRQLIGSQKYGHHAPSLFMTALIKKRYVNHTGALAGHKQGLITVDGEKILITSSPAIISPLSGHCTTILNLVEGLFGGTKHSTQFQYILGWLKLAYECLANGDKRPSQAIALVGPAGCGKSLFQNQIITPLLGGRTARPFQFMNQTTSFNADLFGAEHLMIEDETSRRDIQSRRAFGQMLKNFVANEGHKYHSKGRDGFTVYPLWRVSLSMNDNAEDMLVLPPLSEDIEDKLSLLKCYKFDMPIDTQTVEGRKKLSEAIRGQLPSFVDHLLRFQIPDSMKCSRYGIKHYHHQDILNNLNEISPEMNLLELIDDTLFNDIMHPKDWVGTAGDLANELQRLGSKGQSRAKHLLRTTNSCGMYLGRLAKKSPTRVFSVRTTVKRQWRIIPPSSVELRQS